MERDPATQEVGQGGEQRNEYCFHTGNATWAATEKSTKSMSTVFLVGTPHCASGDGGDGSLHWYRYLLSVNLSQIPKLRSMEL